MVKGKNILLGLIVNIVIMGSYIAIAVIGFKLLEPSIFNGFSTFWESIQLISGMILAYHIAGSVLFVIFALINKRVSVRLDRWIPSKRHYNYNNIISDTYRNNILYDHSIFRLFDLLYWFKYRWKRIMFIWWAIIIVFAIISGAEF